MSADPLKELANRFARLVSTNEGARVAHLLPLHDLLSNPGDSDHLVDNQPAPSDAKRARVGIWEQTEGRKDFVRRWDRQEEWHFWANIGRIAPKRATLRIVVAGESVARGYLFDPQFNVSMALDGLLKSLLGADAIEIIDLARTSIGVEIVQLAHDALALTPDMLIVFAGNNWWWGAGVSSDSFIYRAEVLRQSGVKGLKALVEKQHSEGVRRLVRNVSTVYHEKQIPVMWVVPEFNLGDWRDPLRPAPLLINEKNAQWMDFWKKALDAFHQDDWAAAKSWAERMVEIDEGTSSTGLHLLADCSLRSGDTGRARNYLELARDAMVWETALRSPRSPRAFTVTQEALRAEAENCGDAIVDLPAVFRQYLDDGLPDRRVFLDYCHLSAKGIQVVVAAIGASALKLLKRGERHWRSVLSQSPAPPDRVQAEALFLAAIHNAHHWNQVPDLIADYCMQSLQLHGQIADSMRAFIELQIRSTPVLLSSSAALLADSRAKCVQHYLIREHSHQFDPQLLGAVTAALASIGVKANDLLAKLRLEEHSAERRTINLLDYYYSSATCPLDETYWTYAERVKRAYYRAYSPSSRFMFVAESGRPLLLRLACRLPYAAPQNAQLAIEVNGVIGGAVPIFSVWQTFDVELSPPSLRTGLNEIVLRWPPPEFSSMSAIEAAAEKWLKGAIPELYCAFGEIHSLTVCAVDL